MKLLNISLGIIFSLASASIFSQTEGSAFTYTGMGVSTPFARDYQTLGINAGNLDITPKYNKSITIGLGEVGLSVYSQILTKPELRQNLFQEDIKDFSQAQQKAYATQFGKSDNSFDIDATLFGISVNTTKAGTFAFSTKDRVDFYSKTGQKVSELMWLGYTAPYFDSLIVKDGSGGFDTIPNSDNIDEQTFGNIVEGITSLANAESLTQLLQGTKFGFNWYREFNLGWGKRLYQNESLEIHAGFGLKYLIGQGMLDIDASGGTATAFSALSPVFGVEYGSISDQNTSSLDSNASALTPVGSGYGLDLGTTIIIKKNFYVSAAVNDLGKITWDGNLYKLNDVKIVNFTNPGLESVNFIDQIDQLNGSDGLLSWQGEQKRTTKLPSTARIAFGFDNSKNIKAGIDVIAPASNNPGNLQKAVFTFGGEFSPWPWLHLQAGYSQGGNYGVKIPVGIYFTVAQGAYECGVASRDVVTFFRDNKPTISMAFGFLRFRF